ncbi:unnamed protein product [Spodoptera littoralis]|uniref:Uncharacterized protein n=1 Tax=Spodoptera littoralis TaxID=7109 RepID=A0A9P0I299_SPOLI|nr:unnamed protein product [Spodoptera littoralis]CAH1638476.1 unnamed protein product [Spodoptera littoralis]
MKNDAEADLILAGWALSELAQTCVSLKLRTILGKPHETFMRIEGALKGIAREISSHDTKYLGNDQQNVVEVVTLEQTRTRWITEFMMFLEKYIYNAAEGTAIVLPAVTKPVKTFFHTNWPTCREWLTRVRPAALAVSLHAGHFGAAIYHASLILQTAANSNTNIDVEAITVSIARALIKIEEPEVLLGLYVWIKQNFDKKLFWLKGAAEQANSKHESAIEYYKKINSLSPQEESKEFEIASQVDTRSNRFIDEQIMESYKHIQSWEDMQEWIDKDQFNANSSQWSYLSTLKFFEDTTEIPEELVNWDILDSEANEIPKNVCSYQGLLNKIELTLMCTAVKMYNSDYNDKYEDLLKQCDLLLKSQAEEFSRTNAVHFLKEVAVLQLANHGLTNIVKSGKLITNPFKPSTVKEYNETENILDVDSPLLKLVSVLPEIGLVDNNISENVIPVSDSAVGKLLQFGVNQCPGLAKAWANFAAWCFRWGRKMVEFSSKTREQLTENDKLQIESVMIGCAPQDFEAVCEILSKTKATCDDEDIDWNEINTSEMIESQLRTVPSLSNAFPEHLALLAEDTPHLITFPAVVGAVENEQKDLIELNVARSYLCNVASSGEDNLDVEDSLSDKVINNELNSCFLDMVETLAKQAPKTILQVKLLVKELQRINLLWDELCLGTLVQHHSEFTKRLSQLEMEVAKVKNNPHLSAEDKDKLIKEKHRIIFEPIVCVLEQLYQVTSANPETPHEVSFQNKFQSLIADVIDKLKNPANPDKPQDSWAPLKQLQIKLQQKVNKRTSYILKMSDISPVLAELKNTVITMPGVHTNQRAVRVTIKAVENNVAILPTKTRPKKLSFTGRMEKLIRICSKD